MDMSFEVCIHKAWWDVFEYLNFHTPLRFFLMNSNDTYIPGAAPAVSVCDVYPVRDLSSELVFERADAYLFARAFYTRWGWHPVNTRLVRKLWEKVKSEHELDYLRDIYVLNSRGWILTNPYTNTTRLSAFAIVKVLREVPLYTPGFLD